jgi:hypothetical protein
MHITKPFFKFACYLLAAPVIAGLGVLAQGPPAPGPEHEHLKRLEGEWVASFKGEGGEESKGTMSVKLECGGLWAVSDFRAEFAGQKFQGRGLDGYDPVKKKYVSVWVDSMNTIPLFFEGTMDAATKTLTLTGEGRGPDGKPMKFKSETHFPDNDHMKFTMFVIGDDGKPMPMMTIEYTRKK